MLLLFPLLLAQASPAAGCQMPVELPATLLGWRASSRTPMIGKAFVVEGRAPTAVRGLVTSALVRPGKAALVPIEIGVAGTYRVALSDAAWVDVVRDGTAIASTAHAHGPRCSGIRKIVDFKLEPGRYALQLSGMKTDHVRLLIAAA